MEDYEEFGLGGEEGKKEKREGGFVFWFFVSSSGLEFEAERYYLVDVMQIYIYMDGRYALVCSALYIPCTRERTTS